jgi:hypothetical protein
MVLVSPEAWHAMTRHDADMTSAVLDDRVHAEVSVLVEKGIAKRHLPCPRTWLLSSIQPTPDGGVLFSGFCVTPAEVRAQGDPSI